MYSKKYFINYGGARQREEDEIDIGIQRQIYESSRGSYGFDRRFSFPKDDLRLKIMEQYTKQITPYTDFKKFKSIGEIVAATNLPYKGRERSYKGIYYADDFVKFHGDTYNWIKLQGVTNANYWDTSTSDSLFRIRDGINPTDGLSTFFAGPTFADCGNVIMASIYQYILNIIGTTNFDKLFNSPLSQFIITKYLYNQQPEEKEISGSPIYFLFDEIPDISLENLKDGDIIYVRGVKEYFFKHLAGFAPGWNLVVIKKTGQETKFIGFGPDSFSNGPITYLELKQILITYYNQDRSKETLSKIEQFTDPDSKGISSIGIGDDEHILNQTKIMLSNTLSDDKKPLDSDIIGIQCGIRFNKSKLDSFLELVLRPNSWMTLPIYNGQKFPLISSEGEKIKMSKISAENMKSDFDNYLTDTKGRKELFDLMLRFGNAINSKRPEDPSLGLIISGKPGIGKTHLSIALLKYVNKNVLYVDEKFISDQFQKTATKPDFSHWLKGIELVILDDLNSIYGIGSQFLKVSISYCIANNKSILISSNTHLDVLYTLVPYYISYNSQLRFNYTIVNDLIALSFRKPWSEPLIKLDNKSKMDKILSYTGDQSAGIVLFYDEFNYETLQSMETDIIKRLPYSKIRLAREPLRNQRVYDLYMHDIQEYNIFLIKVENNNEGEQLIRLVENAHDKGSKIIVISKSASEFKSKVDNYLNSFLTENYKVRRTDRLRIIFPGYW
ncbi:hypothetical protein CPAV1605_24 [seawater metagenome]|uniref:Uncharacterized protein n=1 Tax=seawater metagenome TaxID=1561972 RepID=A0A5E8CI14_9ZZZZ